MSKRTTKPVLECPNTLAGASLSDLGYLVANGKQDPGAVAC